MAQAKAAPRDVQQALDAGRDDSSKQKPKESVKKAPEVAKSESARKRTQQVAAEAKAGAEEALKKVAELQAETVQLAEEVVAEKGAANGAEQIEVKEQAEQEEQQPKKSAKLFPEQSPGSNAAAEANGEKANGDSHGDGGRSTNGGAVPGKAEESNGAALEAAEGEGKSNPDVPSPAPAPAPEGEGEGLDLNQSVQGSALAGAAQEAAKAVEQAVASGQARDLLAAATRSTPPANPAEGAAPMQED